MDPDTAYAEFLDAVQRRQLTEATAHAADLFKWLGEGGVEPADERWKAHLFGWAAGQLQELVDVLDRMEVG